MMFFIIACFIGSTVVAAENCSICHRLSVRGKHAKVPCSGCHGIGGTISDPAILEGKGCIGCHKGYEKILQGPMATREREQDFVARTMGNRDINFFNNQCGSCHLKRCTDCHGSGHQLAIPNDNACFSCHRGYFIGAEYHGMAPREDNLRFQRGPVANGQKFLPMIPDLHAEAGMRCGRCHTMKSLIAGKKTGKSCTDCHRPDPKVIDHQIAGHLRGMECVACHASWVTQEYGTFFIRFEGDDSVRKEFHLALNEGEYARTAFYRSQDAPPLGVNAMGKVSPIRPQFILYYTHLKDGKPVVENQLLTASWKAVSPHTVRRGSVMCDSCHGNMRRLMLEPEDAGIFRLKEDGLGLASFWDRRGQVVINGTFIERDRYLRMTEKSSSYQKAYVKKWQILTDGVGR
jgi:hypothetical protein